MTRNSVDGNIEHNFSLSSHFNRLCLKGFEDHVVKERYHKWLVLKDNIELSKYATQVAPNIGCPISSRKSFACTSLICVVHLPFSKNSPPINTLNHAPFDYKST
jgi:hypothetical protein